MGWWQVSADTLAGSRFVLSPLAETFAGLRLLHTGEAAHPGERAWLAAHLPAYRSLLADDPVLALLVRAGLGAEWIADFLTPTPRGGETFEEEVVRVRRVPSDAARGHLRLSLGGPLPAALDRDDLPDLAGRLLTYVWQEAVRVRTGSGVGASWRRMWSRGSRRSGGVAGRRCWTRCGRGRGGSGRTGSR